MTAADLEKLRAREAQIKRRIAEIQAKQKSADRKQRTARLIRWGIVIEAMFRAGKIEPSEWVEQCREVLSARDFAIATAEIHPSLPSEAHLPVSPAEKQCAPAVGNASAG
ncbi:MAG: hypothetical protein H3C26_02585 [Rhodocyclaceae bacterium]|nr:hypothetical protein [Rhodocyclaceae bacterium]